MIKTSSGHSITLHHIIATSTVSNDYFRCTDKQRLSLIGEMKAKKVKKGEDL